MYLGELILRLALVSTSPQPFLAAGLLIALAAIQILRAIREEHIISGYPEYAHPGAFPVDPGSMVMEIRSLYLFSYFIAVALFDGLASTVEFGVLPLVAESRAIAGCWPGKGYP